MESALFAMSAFCERVWKTQRMLNCSMVVAVMTKPDLALQAFSFPDHALSRHFNTTIIQYVCNTRSDVCFGEILGLRLNDTPTYLHASCSRFKILEVQLYRGTLAQKLYSSPERFFIPPNAFRYNFWLPLMPKILSRLPLLPSIISNAYHSHFLRSR